MVKSVRGIGFKRSYLRSSFWRANASIAIVLGVFGLVVVILLVKAVLD